MASKAKVGVALGSMGLSFSSPNPLRNCYLAVDDKKLRQKKISLFEGRNEKKKIWCRSIFCEMCFCDLQK